MCENGLKIPDDPGNLSEFNGNVSKSSLEAPEKTIDLCLKSIISLTFWTLFDNFFVGSIYHIDILNPSRHKNESLRELQQDMQKL